MFSRMLRGLSYLPHALMRLLPYARPKSARRERQVNQEEYMERYHKRSNLESTFSAINRKYGDSVMSRSDVGMVNEVLCKILCHNLTCLIQEQETLGIVPIFWKDEDVATGPDVLPMVRPG